MGRKVFRKKKVRAVDMHRLVYLGNAALRTVSRDVKDVMQIAPVVKAMKSIVGEHQGLGLAGPQVGVNQRFFLMIESIPQDDDTPFTYEAVINPVINSKSAAVTKDFEGCLSFPGYQGVVSRAEVIDVTYTTLDGRKIENRTLANLHARVFQHELDHLDGVMFLDKIDMSTLIHDDEFRSRDYLDLQMLLKDD
ncbi:peptide deformylase [Aphanomyces astaci]|uniref:Peptide deformylase n=1 Tax=Aphanomyces astaci TaxID=112090 RepID=W4GRS1_APHAT|nr:peptide deformylase [Aphanomyces astaci]ETV82397.1 peptide deformylase [Aphanomyces astaci]|eukprot:XP_009828066.1 peptide deformylase [Aphanomyces astaci]